MSFPRSLGHLGNEHFSSGSQTPALLTFSENPFTEGSFQMHLKIASHLLKQEQVHTQTPSFRLATPDLVGGGGARYRTSRCLRTVGWSGGDRANPAVTTSISLVHRAHSANQTYVLAFAVIQCWTACPPCPCVSASL